MTRYLFRSLPRTREVSKEGTRDVRIIEVSVEVQHHLQSKCRLPHAVNTAREISVDHHEAST